MWVLYCSIISRVCLLNFWLIHHSPQLGPQPQSNKAVSFLCSFSTELATFTDNAVKRGLFTLHSKSSLPLLAAKLVFNFCPVLVKCVHLPSWVVGQKQSQARRLQAPVVLVQSSRNSLGINISPFVVCIWLISRALMWFGFGNFVQFYSCVLGKKICLPLHTAIAGSLISAHFEVFNTCCQTFLKEDSLPPTRFKSTKRQTLTFYFGSSHPDLA